MLPLFCFCFGLSSVTAAFSVPASRQSGPTVTLSYGTYQGISARGMDGFFGIKFAQAEYTVWSLESANLTDAAYVFQAIWCP
jgi:hypothetical protein